MTYTTEEAKLSYSLGLSIASSLISSGVKKIDSQAFNDALTTAMEGREPEISPKEANKILGEWFEKQKNEMGQKAKNQGEEFLSKNKSAEGVVTLASGLQYKVLNEGSGKKPTANDSVKCHYEGRLINGNVFDSSIKRGEPAEFPVSGVIKGWVEALQLMNVGSKWQLYIPSDLAYGPNGAGGSIGPNETLIFDVELLEII